MVKPRLILLLIANHSEFRTTGSSNTPRIFMKGVLNLNDNIVSEVDSVYNLRNAIIKKAVDDYVSGKKYASDGYKPISENDLQKILRAWYLDDEISEYIMQKAKELKNEKHR